ncbi:MAG: D-ribose ABC transporter substrate-binding protein [Bacillota bacterium]
MFRNRALALTLTLLLVVGLLVTGCTSKAPATTGNGGSQTKTYTFGVSLSGLNHPFFVDVKTGLDAKAKELGVNLIVTDAQDNTSKQISDIEDLITKKVDVIILNPTDSAAVVPAVEKANAANIPVVTVDRAANGGKVATHIASDNVAAGKMAADFIIQALGGKGKVVELQGIPGSSAARDRGQGFNDQIKTAAGIEIVAAQPADFARAKGLSVMENILQAHPDIDAVFGHNDEMVLGAIEAMKSKLAGKKVVVVGVDAIDDAVKAINDGTMAATVGQKPKLMGEMAVENALKIVKGEKVESFIPVPLDLITKK